MVSLLFNIVLYSVGLFVATFVTTSIPLMIHLSKNTSKLINLVGVGLMIGTGFIVIIPEAVLRGCECPIDKAASSGVIIHGGHLEARDIGLAIVFGYIMMMVADSFVHGHSEEHTHGEDSNDNETLSEEEKDGAVIIISDTNITKLRSTISGLLLHSLFDGLAIGSSIISPNLSVIQTLFWAILLHKISSSVGIGIFIKQLHIPFYQAARYVAIFSAATPVSTVISAMLVQFGSNYMPVNLLGYAFAFSAGTFLHVALTHILPSIGHHIGLVQVIFIIIGVFIPYLLFVEHEH